MLANKVLNFINNQWIDVQATESLDVINPATGDLLCRTPFSTRDEVDQAVQAAQQALAIWRRVPPMERVLYLMKLRNLAEQNKEELARTITMECGKTLDEARGEIQRLIENLEVASGIPVLMQGYLSEDIAPGIDEMMIRQPVGVCAVIAPFNFPAMVPFWFLPYALACGNTYIVKPSEKVPMTMQKIFNLVEQVSFPPGVVNLVNGAKAAVDAILDHPTIRAISFVGSTPVAKYIYSRGATNGKRVQAQGGAKNPVVVLPDADMNMTVKITADSSFGCAGQRCLATSIAITVGEAHDPFTQAICQAAVNRVVGYGLDEGVQMGPVINNQSKMRIEELIQLGKETGAEILVDGRGTKVPDYEKGCFIRPTIVEDMPINSDFTRTEIFGPVLGLIHVNSIDEALNLVNSGRYGNQASIFTTSGSAARRFRYEADAGNIGINIGIAAPMAFFPFSGWRDSFFGDLHGQGKDAVEFFTQKKVVVERWPNEWSRKF